MTGINIDNGKITFNPMGISLEDRIVPEAVTQAVPVSEFAPVSEAVCFNDEGNQVEFSRGCMFGDPAAKLALDRIKAIQEDRVEAVGNEHVVDYVAPAVTTVPEMTC